MGSDRENQFKILNEHGSKLCFDHKHGKPFHLIKDNTSEIEITATSFNKNGEIASLELKSMGGYRLLVNETGIHPQNQTKMISLFSTYYQDNPLEDFKLSAALLYGNILIQKWTNSKSKNKIRFMFEDGNLRTSQSRIPQGPSLMVAKHDDFLEIGIEDPSGLSINSTGLIGQFLGCVEYKIDESKEIGIMSWRSRRDDGRYDNGVAKMTKINNCWTFASYLDKAQVLTSCL